MISNLTKTVLLLAMSACAAGAMAADEPKLLNIYNWSDYIADDTTLPLSAVCSELNSGWDGRDRIDVSCSMGFRESHRKGTVDYTVELERHA